jgi:hypothetical protein
MKIQNSILICFICYCHIRTVFRCHGTW